MTGGLPSGVTGDSNITAITWLGCYFPSSDLTLAQMWALGQSLTASNNILIAMQPAGWATISPTDAITSTSGTGHRLSSTSLHGKFFLGHKSAQKRLHVYDGTTLRRCGLAAPAAAPTGVDTGSGSYATIRYFRVRYTVQVSGATTLRSEPSAVFSFTPSGSGTGVILTKPASISESETHWEVEASTDDANFYRIATVAVGTTTYTDSTAFATGYTTGVLSEPLTSYTLIPSGKYVSYDADRLLIAGDWDNTGQQSRLWWTPTQGNTGVGNDERLDMTVNPFIDLDGYAGGEITGLSKAINGFFFVFKWSQIYKIARTGQRSAAYSAIPLSNARGAFKGSVVDAVDRAGNPAVYFLDPHMGPMRIGVNGLEWCGRDVRQFWSRVNLTATTNAHGVFYQSKNQVHFWVAVDGADYPNAKIVVHCNEIVSSPDGARRGWVTVPVGNRISDAHCSVMCDDNMGSPNVTSQILVPYIGKQQWDVTGTNTKDLIQRCDTGTTDAFTTGDTGAYYYAKVQTKPFIPVGILNKYGVLSASIAFVGVTGAKNYLWVKVTRDFGLEDLFIPIDLNPSANNESIIIRKLDNVNFAECRAMQFTFGDLDISINPATSWRIHAFHMKISPEQTS